MVVTHFLFVFLVFLRHLCSVYKFTSGLRHDRIAAGEGTAQTWIGCGLSREITGPQSEVEREFSREHLSPLRRRIPQGGQGSVAVIAVLLEKPAAGFSETSVSSAPWQVGPCDPFTHVLFPLPFISLENCTFLFPGEIHQAVSSPHLPAPVSSTRGTLVSPSLVREARAVLTNVSGKKAVCLGMPVPLRLRLVIFLPKRGPRWTVGACVQRVGSIFHQGVCDTIGY